MKTFSYDRFPSSVLFEKDGSRPDNVLYHVGVVMLCSLFYNWIYVSVCFIAPENE